MANRDNHYEAAFEEYLRVRQVPYVAVDESRRALLGDVSLKSLDFLVSPAAGPAWLVDVKGRRFPSGGQNKQYWRNWSTADDLRSLAAWQTLLGLRAQGLFVFAYEIVADRAPLPLHQLFAFRDRLYGFVGVRLSDYQAHARPLSAAWNTVSMPTAKFREMAAPVDDYFHAAPPDSLAHAHAAPSTCWDDCLNNGEAPSRSHLVTLD
ncbi:MAG: HYExAFE family protein [Pirellulales bacterium]|nr:HYExAFE family protein [Pirellulales bacterium]